MCSRRESIKQTQTDAGHPFGGLAPGKTEVDVVHWGCLSVESWLTCRRFLHGKTPVNKTRARYERLTSASHGNRLLRRPEKSPNLGLRPRAACRAGPLPRAAATSPRRWP